MVNFSWSQASANQIIQIPDCFCRESVENDPMGSDLDHLDHDPMVDPMVEVMTPWLTPWSRLG